MSPLMILSILKCEFCRLKMSDDENKISGFKVNLFCLLKIRIWLSTKTFHMQRALNIQSFTPNFFLFSINPYPCEPIAFFELYVRQVYFTTDIRFFS